MPRPQAADSFEDTVRYWRDRTSLPKALEHPYATNQPGQIVSRGNGQLAASAVLTTETVVPKFRFDPTNRASVLKFNRMIQSVLPIVYPIGGMPIFDSNGKIVAATSQTQAGAQAIALSLSAWRLRAGLNTVFDVTANIYALHGATAAAARYPMMSYAAMHTDRNPAYYLTREAAIGLGGGLLAGGVPIGTRPTFNDGAHVRPLYNFDPYAIFGGATAAGGAQCIFIGRRAATPNPMLINDSYFLSLQGYVQEGTGFWSGYGHIEGLQFSPSGDNMNQLLKIYVKASFPGITGRRESRLPFEVFPASGMFSYGTPTGYGADYSVDRRLDFRFEYRKTLNSPWQILTTFVEAFKAETAEEMLPLAEVVGVRLSSPNSAGPGVLKLDVIGPPGSHIIVEEALAPEGPWKECFTYSAETIVTTIGLEHSHIEVTAYFRAQIAKYRPSEAEIARAAGLPESRIISP